jgi:hypothetical protein
MFDKTCAIYNETYWKDSTDYYVKMFDINLKDAQAEVEGFLVIAINNLAKLFECGTDQMRDVLFSVPNIPSPFKCIVGLVSFKLLK